MIVEQISIFLENKAGRLMEVTEALADAKINICALSLADTSDFGILRLIVDDNEKAKNMLRERGFTVGRTNVVAVEVNNTPGGLHYILDVLRDSQINVEYMYAYMQPKTGCATLIFRFDRTEAALEVLQKKDIPILPASKVSG